MVKKLSLHCLRHVGLDFFEFLGETDRTSITDRSDLKDIYENEFRLRNDWAKDPNFGSVLYALKVSKKVIRRGHTILFNFSVRFQYQDQWHSPRDCQPSMRTWNAYHDGINICHRCVLFYDTFVAIAPNKCEALERGTVEQSGSRMWHGARKVRITASTAKKVPIRANPQNYIRSHLYPSFHGNAATHHGTESEALAYQWLQNCGYVVRRSGTVVCAQEPWLSASPDGVLNSEELLEIKSPFLMGDESLKDLIRSQKYDVKMVEGTYQPQKNGRRDFYMQVQLGMFCTGLRACKLLIWTPDEPVLLQVPYDEQFCANTVARLKTFYFKCMLPIVSDEFQAGRLLLSDKYLQLCTE